MTKFNILEIAREIKGRMMAGEITYDEAVEMLQDPIKEANKRAKKVAITFGRRPPVITAQKLLRQ